MREDARDEDEEVQNAINAIEKSERFGACNTSLSEKQSNSTYSKKIANTTVFVFEFYVVQGRL